MIGTPGTRRLFFSLALGATCAAIFLLPSASSAAETLTVTAQGSGLGSISSSPPGIKRCSNGSLPGTCTASWAKGAVVTLTARAEEGAVFVGWTGGCTGTATTCSVTMSAAKSVTGVFSQAALPSGDSLENPSFETNASGYSDFNGVTEKPTREAATAAPNGSFIGHVIWNEKAGGYSLSNSTGAITVKPGALYRAVAWVKGSPQNSGKEAKLRVREWSGGTVTGSTSQSFTLSSGSYNRVEVTYRAPTIGGGKTISLDVFRGSSGLVSGESFYVDALSLGVVQTPKVEAFGSLPTIRPAHEFPAGGSASKISLTAMRNEFRSFQVAVRRPEGEPVKALSFSWSTPPTGPSGAIPATTAHPDLVIYREADYRVPPGLTSDLDAGAAGLWPDALIPQTDYLFHEERKAFPVEVAATGAEDTGTAWFDVLIPEGYAAGTYTGTVHVSWENDEGGRDIEVAITVPKSALPSSSHIQAIFPIASYQPCTAFYNGEYDCPTEADAWELGREFALVGLDNRVSVANPEPDGYGDIGGQVAIVPGSSAAKSFEAKIGPLFAGTAATRQPGAKLGAQLLYWSCAFPKSSCVSNWEKLAEANGLKERLLFHPCDEPGTGFKWSNTESPYGCDQNAAEASAAWSGSPSIRKMITTWIADPGLNETRLGYTDTLSSLINDMDPSGSGSQRAAYDSWLEHNAAGTQPNEVWLYNSCRSFAGGCREGVSPGEAEEVEASESAGWPGYAIDAGGARAEAMGWEDFAYKASGEYYYSAANGLAKNKGGETPLVSSAWQSQYYAGVHGDGNLFYPGLPTGNAAAGIPAIGGTKAIPIESMRLKRIRDGLQDYEYLRMAAEKSSSEASTILQSLFGSKAGVPGTTANDGFTAGGPNFTQSRLDAAREALLAIIE